MFNTIQYIPSVHNVAIYNYSIFILLILYDSEILLSSLGYTDGVQPEGREGSKQKHT